MLSVSYTEKNAYITGKTSGVLRDGASGANKCYVLAHCGGGEERLQGYLSSIASGTELGNYVPSFLSNCPKLLISDSIFKKTKLKAYQV